MTTQGGAPGRWVAPYVYLGYDPAEADWSPGAVLHSFARQRMVAEPDIVKLDWVIDRIGVRSAVRRSLYRA